MKVTVDGDLLHRDQKTLFVAIEQVSLCFCFQDLIIDTYVGCMYMDVFGG